MLSEDNCSSSNFKSVPDKQNRPLGPVSCKLTQLANSIKNKVIGILQLAIVKADIALEFWRLKMVNRINHCTDSIQARLFLTSMWLDERRYG